LESLVDTARFAEAAIGRRKRSKKCVMLDSGYADVRRGQQILFLTVNCLLFPQLCNAATDLTRIRALHMEGNWGGNRQGIKEAGPGLLNSAVAISVTDTSIVVNRSSFINPSGATIINDVAQVRLSGVMLGSTPLAQAGFWIGRTSTQNIVLQFRPSLDSSLQGVPGFAGDITFSMPVDGSSVDISQMSLATGTALNYVASIVANGPALVTGGTFSINAPSTFDQDSVAEALQKLLAAVQASHDEYFAFLKNENVNWLGISVAIFNDSLADPTVKVHYRPTGDTSQTTYTFDDADLKDFILRAKQQFGLHIYLTLAFEPSSLDMPPSLANPACRMPGYKVNRWFLGAPSVASGDPNQACINPAFWWWNPTHPNYAQNVAQFWNTYTEVAVKYGSLCQEMGVEMFSLGTETDHLFRTRTSSTWTNHFGTQLTQMVRAVRAVYSGLLTYDQHWLVLARPQNFDGGGGSNFLFRDLALDVVGVSAYFQLATAPVTRVLSVNELEAAWDSVFRNYLIPLQTRNPGVPIIFTEFGYTDDLGSPAQATSNAQKPAPPRDANGATGGMQQQQNIFQAFFNVDDRYNDLVQGAFIWGNQIFTNVSALMCSTINFNIYCKPSAQTIANIYGGWLDAAGGSQSDHRE
jgi:hypothetical protein